MRRVMLLRVTHLMTTVVLLTASERMRGLTTMVLPTASERMRGLTTMVLPTASERMRRLLKMTELISVYRVRRRLFQERQSPAVFVGGCQKSQSGTRQT